MSLLEQPKSERKKWKKFPKNPDNPSPSGDPYWDNPANLEALDRAIAEMDAGKTRPIEDCPELMKIFAKYGGL